MKFIISLSIFGRKQNEINTKFSIGLGHVLILTVLYYLIKCAHSIFLLTESAISFIIFVPVKYALL